jgi:hypothetical protein
LAFSASRRIARGAFSAPARLFRGAAFAFCARRVRCVGGANFGVGVLKSTPPSIFLERGDRELDALEHGSAAGELAAETIPQFGDGRQIHLALLSST